MVLSLIKKMLSRGHPSMEVIVVLPRGEPDAEKRVNNWIAVKRLKVTRVIEVDDASSSASAIESIDSGGRRVVVVTVSSIAFHLRDHARSKGYVLIDVDMSKGEVKMGC